ncbi:glycosyltransferase family 4 protein [bacterium]|nr:glycosyltransferase family 4 protein [bacterium]
MKILLLHDNPPPGGGAEKQFLGLRNELRKRGHDARLFTSTASKKQSVSDYECFGTISSFRTLLQTYNRWAYQSLKKVLEDFRPDVVQANIYLTQLSPSILPLLQNIPSIYYAVWYRSICPIGTKMLPDNRTCFYPAGRICLRTGCLPLRDWIPLMYQMKMQRRWQGVFELVVAVSEAVRVRLVAEGVPATHVNWPGVAIQEKIPEKSPTPQVVFAGRLVKEKGCDILLRAFGIVRHKCMHAQLVIAGDGPERTRLERMKQELHLDSCVTFTGHISSEEVQQRFASARVQVIPSVWPEPLPIAAMEGMMNGSVVVASRIGGLPEIIQDGETGFLVEPGNPQDLAAAIQRAFDNLEIGQAAHEFALSHLTEEKSVNRFISLYEHVLQKPAG